LNISDYLSRTKIVKLATGKALLLLVMAASLMVADAAWGIIVDRIVAKVNDDIITLSEVQEKGMPLLSKVRATHSADNKKVEEAEKEVLDRLIDIKLQLQDARRLGLKVRDEDVEKALKNIREKNGITPEAMERILKESGTSIQRFRDEIRDRILEQKVYYFRVIASAKVNPDAVEAYYQEHISDYKRKEEVKVSQIFFAVDENNPAKREDVVQARAMEVLDKIKTGEDFSQLARAYSEGANASEGGRLGSFKRGEALPVLEKTMFSLKSGMVSGLIRSKAGFHVIRVDDHVYPTPLPLEEVKEKIIKAIKEEKAQGNYKKWMRKLKEKAFIEITYDLGRKKS